MNNDEKIERALNRVRRGDVLNMMPSGQFKFGGNKFIPKPVVKECLKICGDGVKNNRGWLVFRLSNEPERVDKFKRVG